MEILIHLILQCLYLKAYEQLYSYLESSSRKESCPLPEEFVDKSNELIETAILDHEKSLHTATRLILDYELFLGYDLQTLDY